MARSLFHHGILLKEDQDFIFNDDDNRKEKIKKNIKKFVISYRKKILKKLGINLLEASMILSLNNKNVDTSIIGARSKKQIDEILNIKIQKYNSDYSKEIIKIASDELKMINNSS